MMTVPYHSAENKRSQDKGLFFFWRQVKNLCVKSSLQPLSAGHVTFLSVWTFIPALLQTGHTEHCMGKPQSILSLANEKNQHRMWHESSLLAEITKTMCRMFTCHLSACIQSQPSLLALCCQKLHTYSKW